MNRRSSVLGDVDQVFDAAIWHLPVSQRLSIDKNAR
jgi:hypothetical protein